MPSITTHRRLAFFMPAANYLTPAPDPPTCTNYPAKQTYQPNPPPQLLTF